MYLCSACFALLHLGPLCLHSLLQLQKTLLLLPVRQPIQQACKRCQGLQ